MKCKLSHRIVFAWVKSLSYVADNKVDFILFIFHACNEKQGLLHFHIWKNLPPCQTSSRVIVVKSFSVGMGKKINK